MITLRRLFAAPAFALTAILTIALGIGVNTAVFSVIHRVLLNPLPFREPQRLVHVAETHPDFPSFQVAAPDFFDWQRLNQSFDGLAAHTFQAINKWVILGDGEPEPVQVVQASAGLFPLLGISPLLGRTFTAEEEAKKAPVVVIAESLWRRRYQADPGIVGRKIRLMDWPVTVVGVMSRQQAHPAWGEVWMPLTFLDPALTESRRFHALEVVGRLKSGVTVERAQAEMGTLAASLGRAHPATNASVGIAVLPLEVWIAGESRPLLFAAWAAVGLVLLLACANVAHLVLIRAVERQRELGIRQALGASGFNLSREILVENLTVAAFGGALGIVLARAGLPLLLARLNPGDLPRFESASLSGEALLFGGVATLGCGLIFALPALLHLPRRDIQALMHPGSGRSLHRGRRWFGPAIAAAEIAIAFAVIVGAGLLYRSFETLTRERPGFESRDVLVAEIPLGFGSWADSERHFVQRVAPRLREIPGVREVAAANVGPLMLQPTELSRFSTRFGIEGRVFARGEFPVAQMRWTTPGYFSVLQIPIREGRGFEETDLGKPAYIVNQTFARLYFPNQNPIGKQVLMNVVTGTPQKVPIIGVVADVRDLGLEVTPRPTLYQLGVSNAMTVLLRTDGPPTALIDPVRRLLRSINPNEPIRTLAPLDSIREASLTRRRLALDLLGVFAALAAALTAIGVYGVISYALSQRRGEFAVRLALGSTPTQLVRLIARGFVFPWIGGLLLGTGLGWALAQALRTQLYRLSPADPVVWLATGAGLAVLVLAAGLRPAANATKISPIAILRQ